MFQAEVVEKIKIFSVTFFLLICAVYEILLEEIVEPDRHCMLDT
jgi:hypothetical protein